MPGTLSFIDTPTNIVYHPHGLSNAALKAPPPGSRGGIETAQRNGGCCFKYRPWRRPVEEDGMAEDEILVVGGAGYIGSHMCK